MRFIQLDRIAAARILTSSQRHCSAHAVRLAVISFAVKSGFGFRFIQGKLEGVLLCDFASWN